MKLIVLTADGFSLARPDTSWNRKNSDFYVPDNVQELYWAPVAYSMVERPGKCIAQRFAGRYLGTTGFGVLLYVGSIDSPGAFAQANCYDNSSIIPVPLPEGSTPKEKVSFYVDGNEEFTTPIPTPGFFADAAEKTSRSILFRNGDILLVELASPQPLDLSFRANEASLSFRANEASLSFRANETSLSFRANEASLSFRAKPEGRSREISIIALPDDTPAQQPAVTPGQPAPTGIPHAPALIDFKVIL